MRTECFSQDDIQFDNIKGQLDAKKKELLDKKKQLEDKIKSKPFKVSGSVSVSGLANFDSETPVDPFSYVVTGNVKAEIYGYSLPFSFTYSNLKLNYTNPSFKFNRMAFNPDFSKLGGQFKKLKGHFGDISTTLSPYTMSGMQFTGADFEYEPTKWKFQILGGRFLRAIAEDTSGTVKPSYKRLGGGFKVGYNADKLKLGLAVFYAKDAQNSIPAPENINYSDIKPMENLAFAIQSGFPVSKDLTWDSELSTSVLTLDLNDHNSAANNSLFTKSFSTLLPNTNASTKVYSAVKTGLNYKIGKEGLIGMAFERVDPNYRTLGGYYFTNDFENLTVNSQYHGKVNVQFSTGLQHDDLANTGKSNLNKMVVLANISFKPTEKMDVSANYSNFQSYTFIRTPFDKINKLTPYDNLDTLNFTQLSQNASVNLNYNFQQSETGFQSLTLLFSFLESANQSKAQNSVSTAFFNSTLNYVRSFTALDLSVTSGFNYALSAGVAPSTTYGPTFSASKKLFDKKVSTTWGASFNRANINAATTDILNLSMGVNTTLKEKHNLSFSLSNQWRRISVPVSKSVRLNATIGYNYNF